MKSEYEILLTFIQGSEEERNATFELIYKEKSPYPYRSALVKHLNKKIGFTKHKTECQELLNDTFLGVFEKPDNALKALSQGVELGKYFMGILRNKIYSRYRNLYREEEINEGMEDIIAPQEEVDECLVWAMESLKETDPLCEKLLRLRFYFGYRSEEMAEIVNRTRGYVDNIMKDRCYSSFMKFYLSCTQT
ncbi:RNA polymerase sigma factor [Siphonobacter curvatus]|uniref:Sigma-70 family RNA polymerase sigma factor n=1 Tax=Siphonobacter curvatus TaxID=2094562 RepID=A0A2S7IJ71_9BACT|nr:sigma-70 family RNA polymerase sigma factor [Siphonobacter curvatus]PQA56364.1 hypothetical protein C5O19_18680 [Siphonobacter curvatus]